MRIDGRAGVMRQLVGSIRDDTTVRAFLVTLAAPPLRKAAAKLADAERAVAERPNDTDTALKYADALGSWGDAGGYDAEVFWDVCLTEAFGVDLGEVGERPVATLSGGEQKRLALEVLLRGTDDVLLLDEPDNFLDIPAKRRLEDQLRATNKTILYVSHDRELLAATATKVVTLEASGAWTHGASFATYYEARDARRERIDDEHTRHMRERDRLEAIMKEMKRRASFADNFAPKAKAAESRLRHFDEAGPPPERVTRPEDHHAARRRPHGQARRDARTARARRTHRSVRRRAVVRRARRGRRPERHRQEPLPAPARRARDRPPRRLAPRRERRAGLLQPDPRPSRARRAARSPTSSPAAISRAARR